MLGTRPDDCSMDVRSGFRITLMPYPLWPSTVQSPKNGAMAILTPVLKREDSRLEAPMRQCFLHFHSCYRYQCMLSPHTQFGHSHYPPCSPMPMHSLVSTPCCPEVKATCSLPSFPY